MTETDHRAVMLLKALAQPVRFQIVSHLKKGSTTPARLCQALKRNPACISQHLRVLKSADAVSFVTRYRAVEYSLKDAQLVEVLQAVASYNEKVAARR